MLLPVLAFAVCAVALYGKTVGRPVDWRDAFLKGTVLWGAAVALLAEGLGLLGWIQRAWLALAWLLVAGLALAWGARTGYLVEGWRRLRSLRLPRDPASRGLVAGLLLLSLLLLVVALAAPANNVDSLYYHMSRVVHWAQNGSLMHYAASAYPQVTYPPWAETAILHLRLLWGSDRPANLVQWFSMVGSLVAASAVAGTLGAGRSGQLVASAFVASVPMGVLQATSTQNDYVVSFWAAALAYFVVRGWRGGPHRPWAGYVGLAFSLGLLTKATFVVYGVPLLAGYALVGLSRSNLTDRGLRVLGLAGLVVLLNAGVWARNLATYGGLYGSSEVVGSELAILDLLGPPPLAGGQSGASAGGAQDDTRAQFDGGTPRTSFVTWGAARVVQAAALNLVAPLKPVNDRLQAFADALPKALVGESTLDALSGAAWNHEDTAGNPLHLAAVPLSLAVLPLSAGKAGGRRAALLYAGISLVAFVLLPILFRLGTAAFGVRLQLPFFVLWGPVVGVAASRLRSPRLAALGGAALMASALPYALLNNTRPVIGHTPWPTRVGSVFSVASEELAFAGWPELREPYAATVDLINNRGCKEVGLSLDSGDPEYLLWWLFEAPQSGVRLEVLHTEAALQRFIDGEFEPCAVICTICRGRAGLGELRWVTDFAGVSVFGE